MIDSATAIVTSNKVIMVRSHHVVTATGGFVILALCLGLYGYELATFRTLPSQSPARTAATSAASEISWPT